MIVVENPLKRRVARLLVSYMPLAKAQSTAAKFYAIKQRRPGIRGCSELGAVPSQQVSAALRVGTLASPSWLSHACIGGLHRL